ncbi:MAG: tRNA (guanosine(46)-N7)-methyltransferase TrmB [Cyclobacteriaceae bacterium]|nr:tRNA (guanosine(46)-N7)-methyltransferase TrmB [Cyclobacteriaceae bacterium HetDA_MAG_MS6]
MRQKKKRFEDNAQRVNVLEPGKDLYETIKGNWGSAYFQNDNDVVVELGCGRGEYTIGLAQVDPTRNYVGIDLKGDRIWVGSSNALDLKLYNVAFLRTQMQFIQQFFSQGEVSEIWITFPDPRPKDRDEKRRLTFPKYLEMYRHILKSEGWVKFKTDNTDLFNYTLDVLERKMKIKGLEYSRDLYQSELNAEHFGIKTKYEHIFSEKGEKIKYLKFQFDD